MVRVVVVRHGQATHNLPTYRAEQLVVTEEVMPFMDSPLTPLGREQAGLVARRLAATTFHLGLTSDLARARDTAQTILASNHSISTMEETRLLRERNNGFIEFEHKMDVGMAQWTVEDAIEDRSHYHHHQTIIIIIMIKTITTIIIARLPLPPGSC